MKKTALIIAALTAAGITYAADGANVTTTTKPSYSVTSDFSYTSEYVFRGIKQSNAAFQGSLEVGQDDARVGVWTSQPINSKGEDINEFDFYAGYKLRLSRDLTADFVGTYYYYPEAVGTPNPAVAHSQTHHSYELGVGGTYDLGAASPALAGVSSSLYYYYDFRLKQQTLQASLGYSFPLKEYGTSLDFSVFAGTVSARDLRPDDPGSVPAIKETYNYYGIGLNIPYKLAENAQVHVGVSYAANSGLNAGLGRDPHQTLAANAGITLGF